MGANEIYTHPELLGWVSGWVEESGARQPGAFLIIYDQAARTAQRERKSRLCIPAPLHSHNLVSAHASCYAIFIANCIKCSTWPYRSDVRLPQYCHISIPRHCIYVAKHNLLQTQSTLQQNQKFVLFSWLIFKIPSQYKCCLVS